MEAGLALGLPAAVAGGAIIALLLGLFGGGGSVLATPLLLYIVGIADPHVAIGTGAAAVAVNAAANLAVQARAGSVKWPCALSFAGAGLAGSLTGAVLAQRVDGQALLSAFALAMLAVGLAMLRPAKAEGDPTVRLDLPMTLKLVPAGLVVGLAAGFFGIGGGFLIVPGLMASTGMSLATAQATSLLSVAAFGATTAGNYALSGWVDAGLVAAMTAGGVVGTVAGLPLARRLGANAGLGRSLFAGMILIVAVYVAIRAVMAL